MTQAMNPADFLAKLEDELREIDERRTKIIAAIDAIRPLVPAEILGARGAAGSAGPYASMSIAAAAQKVLGEARKPLTTREIIDALTAGGMQSTSQNLGTTVAGALNRHLGRIFVRDSGSWALASWGDTSGSKTANARQASTSKRKNKRPKRRRRASKWDGVPLPTTDSEQQQRGAVELPASPHRPAGVPDDWIPVAIADAAKQTLLLGILRAEGRPLSVKRLVQEIDARSGGLTNQGTVFNISSRLEDRHVLKRSEEGFELIEPAKAPFLNARYVWGHPETLQSTELSARRREAIVRLLAGARGGLQNAEILAYLERDRELRTPLSKDVIKTDMEQLRDAKKAHRLPNSLKWVLSDVPAKPAHPLPVASD